MNNFTQNILNPENPYISEFYKDSDKFKIHMHKSIEVIYVVKGSLNIIIDYRKYTIEENHAVFINSFIAHTVLKSSNNDVHFYCIQFLPELTYLYENDFINKDYFLWFSAKKENKFSVCKIEKGSDIEKYIENAYTIYIKKHRGYEFELHSQILLMCTFFYENTSFDQQNIVNSTSNNDVVLFKNIFDYIEENYNATTQTKLTKKFATNQNFTKLFKQITGYTIGEYFEFYRFNLAKLLLSTTSFSITKIAFSLGFSNSSYFSKRFFSYCKESPTAFRKQTTLSSFFNEKANSLQIIKEKTDEPSPTIDNWKNGQKPFHNLILNSVYIEDDMPDKWSNHNLFQIIFMDSGDGILETENNSVSMRPGSMVFLYPNEKYHFIKFSEKVNILLIQFFPDILSLGKKTNPAKEDLYKIPFEKRTNIYVYDDENSVLSESFLSLYKEVGHFRSKSEIVFRAHCLNIISWLISKQDGFTLISESQNQYKHDDTVKEIINYINEHYTESLQLAELALKYSVSYSHLSRKFKKITGTSFNRYINYKRTTHANYLLMTTNYSIRKISMLLGYCRRSHFTEEYTKRYKITPFEFRERIKSKKPINELYLDKENSPLNKK